MRVSSISSSALIQCEEATKDSLSWSSEVIYADVTKRLLGTRDFLKEVGKQGGFRKDITAFHERWIAGQGSPKITAAFSYLK